MPKHFTLNIDNRPTAILLTIYEESEVVGHFLLKHEDEDLVKHVRELVKRFNEKYNEESPQTTTGPDTGVKQRLIATNQGVVIRNHTDSSINKPNL